MNTCALDSKGGLSERLLLHKAWKVHQTQGAGSQARDGFKESVFFRQTVSLRRLVNRRNADRPHEALVEACETFVLSDSVRF